jgi:hypothetical protein
MHKISIQNIRSDNAGENKALKNEYSRNINITPTFEFTSPNRPPQNGRVERMFATLFCKVRPMPVASGFSKNLRFGGWTYAAFTSAKLDSRIVSSEQEQTPEIKFYGTTPNFVKFLHPFGYIAIVSNARNNKILYILSNKERDCTFIGYTDDHTPDCYISGILRTDHLL